MRFMPEMFVTLPGMFDPQVARDGQDGHRLGGRVEAGHHGDVAALAARVGLVAERVDLGRVVDEGPRVGADQQHVEGLLSR